MLLKKKKTSSRLATNQRTKNLSESKLQTKDLLSDFKLHCKNIHAWSLQIQPLYTTFYTVIKVPTKCILGEI